MLTRQLLIFAKAPRMGRVKRRLARGLGEVPTLNFYRRTTADLLRRLGADPRWRTYLAVSPDSAASTGQGLWSTPVTRLPQGAGDLGRRMHRAARRRPPGPVVIIGADIPDIGPAHIAAAFRLLDRCDMVFGPACDGGYWLVGFRRRPVMPDPFRHVRWSTAHALADTIANLGDRTYATVACLDDIDDIASYRRWRRRQ